MHLSLEWCEIERFQQKFLPPGYVQSHLAFFAKNRFSSICGSCLEFLHKTQKLFPMWWGTGISDTLFLSPTGFLMPSIFLLLL